MNKYFLNIKIKQVVIVGVLLLLYSLTPLLWFEKGKMLAGGEASYYLSFDCASKKAYYTWDDKNATPSVVPSHIFFLKIWEAFRKLGLTIETSQRLILITVWCIMPFSMFYLFQSLNLAKNDSAIGGLLASTLYLYNVFYMNAALCYYLHSFSSFLPLIVAFLIKGLKVKSLKKNIKYSFAIACSIVGMSTIAVNVSYIATLILISTVIFAAYFKKDYLKQQVSFLMLCIIFTILLNFYWLAELHSSLTSVVSGIVQESVPNSKQWNSAWSAKLFDSLRLLGSWAFRYDFYYPFNGYFYGKSYLITCYSYIIPILIFSSLLIKKNKKEITIFSLIALIGIFLVKGSCQPFGGIFLYFFDLFTWMAMFRSPYEKFTGIVVFAYSILYGYIGLQIFSHIQNKFSRDKKNILSLLFLGTIILLTIITAFPTVMKLIDSPLYANATIHVKLPHYWEMMANWFYKTDPNSRVMSLPETGYGSIYKLEKTIAVSSVPLTSYIIPNSTTALTTHSTYGSGSYYVRIANSLYSCLGKPKILNNLLDILSVKYIVQQNDVCNNHPAYRTRAGGGPRNPKQIKMVLEKNAHIVYLESFGKLDIYHVTGNTETIYAR